MNADQLFTISKMTVYGVVVPASTQTNAFRAWLAHGHLDRIHLHKELVDHGVPALVNGERIAAEVTTRLLRKAKQSGIFTFDTKTGLWSRTDG